jgi:hypothetical protein
MRTELVFYDVNYYFPYFYYLQTLILRCNRRYNWKVGGVCGTRGHEKKKSLEIGCSHHLTKHTLLWVLDSRIIPNYLHLTALLHIVGVDSALDCQEIV